MSSKTINQRVINSVGRSNYNEYMLLTEGKELDSILNDYSPVFQMYNYRDKMLDEQDIDNVKITINDLKQSLEQIFLDYLCDSEFKIVKDMLVNHINGWNIEKLLEIHKKHKYYRIFRLLTTDYNNWLN
jgi:hypothetical protein